MSETECDHSLINDSKDFVQQTKGYDPRVLNQINKTIAQAEALIKCITETGDKLTSIISELTSLRVSQKKGVSPVKKEVKKATSVVYDMNMFTSQLLQLFNMTERGYGIEEKELVLRMKSAMTDGFKLKPDLDVNFFAVFNISDKEREIHNEAYKSNPDVCINTTDFGLLIKRVLVKNTTIRLGDSVVNLRNYLNNTPVDTISNELVKHNLASIQHNDIVLNEEVFDALNELNRTSGRQLEASKISLSKFNRFLLLSKDHDDIYVEAKDIDDLFVELNGIKYAKHGDYSRFLKKKSQANKSQ
jgi:hypothetical protein